MLYGPVPAKRIGRRQKGIARLSLGPKPRFGVFIDYRPGRSKRSPAPRAVIANMLVTVSVGGGHIARTIPFRVDTGSEVTVIPSRLMPEVEEAIRGAGRGRRICGVGGEILSAVAFSATVVLISPGRQARSIIFAPPEVSILRSSDLPWGILGLDAMREIVLVLDHDHVAFWYP